MHSLSFLTVVALALGRVDAVNPTAFTQKHIYQWPNNNAQSACRCDLYSTIVTPKATTVTTTTTLSTTTTLPVVTDTFTSTITSTETDSTTTTTTTEITTSSTTTVTTGGGVSTVPIPNGFIYPTPTPGGLKAKRGGAVIPRAAAPNSPHCSGGVSALKYPYKVVCDQLVESIIPKTFTVTAKKTTTLTASTPTSTSVISQTSTITSTLPDASTTITQTSSTTTTLSSTETDTITDTVTATATYMAPVTSTTYPVCATAANQVSSTPDGQYLQLITGSNPSDFYTANAYDCCVACFQTAGCIGSNYGAGYGSVSCELELTGDGSCPANQGAGGVTYTGGGAASLALTFSNGPCGTNLFQ